MSETILNLEILRSGLKLDHSVDNLFMKSIVYDFLRRNVNAEIANEFKLLYGPFKDLNGLTLEELFGLYNKKYKVISTNPIPSTSQTLSKSNKKVSSNKPEIISVPSASHAVIQSNKKVKVKSQTLVKGRFSIEEDNIMIETVQKYDKSKKTWKKLRVELN